MGVCVYVKERKKGISQAHQDVDGACVDVWLVFFPKIHLLELNSHLLPLAHLDP